MRESEVSVTITPRKIGSFHLSYVKQEDPSENKYRGKTNFLGSESEEIGSSWNPSSGLPVTTLGDPTRHFGAAAGDSVAESNRKNVIYQRCNS